LRREKKVFFSLIRLLIAVSMLWYLVQSGSIEWSSFTGMLTAWPFTLLAIFLFFIATTIQAYRLQSLINAHELNLGFFASMKLTFIGVFFTTYLPGAAGGDLIKFYYASKGNPGKRTEVITILLLDRFIGLFSLLTIPILLAPFFIELIISNKPLQYLLLGSTGAAITIIIISLVGIRCNLETNQLLQRIGQTPRFGNLIFRTVHTVHYYRNRIGIILRALLITYLLQLTMVGVSLCVAQSITQTGADINMLLMVPMGYLANALPITPGGLGIGEAAMESLFNMVALSGGAETILGWRLILIIVGLLGLFFYLRGHDQFISIREINRNTA
jgi:uncharacterized protein (TIRG00374 family)